MSESTVNYDSDGLPVVPDEMHDLAEDLGLQVVHVICLDADSRRDEAADMSFVVMTAHLPRVGEVLHLEDGQSCRVQRVSFKVHRLSGFPSLSANVVARLEPTPSARCRDPEGA